MSLRQDWFKHSILLLLLLVTLFPMYFVLANSFKTAIEYAQSTVAFPSRLEVQNYISAWRYVSGPIFNSTLIVTLSVIGILVTASLSAYAFALLTFRGREVLFNLVFLLLLIPGFLTLIPLYLQIKQFGLSGNPLGLIFPYIAAGQAFSIFVIKTFFEQVSKELLEAAKIDGATELQVFARIVLPLSVPVLVSVGIINFVPLWNDLLLPQLVLGEQSQTVTMALVSFQGTAQSRTSTNFGALMAGYVLASVPLIVIFTFLMRYYIEGLSSGAVKG